MDTYKTYFSRIAASLLILLSVYNSYGVYQLLSAGALSAIPQPTAESAEAPTDSRDITIVLSDIGYDPDEITLPRNTNINLTIKNNNAQGCIQSFTIPKLQIQKVVRTGTTDTVTFATPNRQTDLAFTCSMGMYRGVIHVL